MDINLHISTKNIQTHIENTRDHTEISLQTFDCISLFYTNLTRTSYTHRSTAYKEYIFKYLVSDWILGYLKLYSKVVKDTHFSKKV